MVEASAAFVNVFIVISLVVGFIFALVQFFKVSKIRSVPRTARAGSVSMGGHSNPLTVAAPRRSVSVEPDGDRAGLTESLTHSAEEGKGDEYKEEDEGPERSPEQTEALMHTIHSAISEGATAFLWEEYKVIAIYVAVFAVLVRAGSGIWDGWGRLGFGREGHAPHVVRRAHPSPPRSRTPGFPPPPGVHARGLRR